MEERRNNIEKMTKEQQSIRSISVIAHVKKNIKKLISYFEYLFIKFFNFKKKRLITEKQL